MTPQQQAEQEAMAAAAEEEARNAAQQGDVTATGLGKSAATGLRNIPESFVGSPGDLFSWETRKAGQLAQWLGASPETVKAIQEYGQNPTRGPGYVTTPDVQAATDTAVKSAFPGSVGKTIQDITRHPAQNMAEEGTQTATQLLPMLLSPGTWPQKLATWLATSGGVETAGQVTRRIAPEWESTARLGAGILIPGARVGWEAYKAAPFEDALKSADTNPAAVKTVEPLVADQGMTPEDVGGKMRDIGNGAMPLDTEPGSGLAREAQRIQARGGEGGGLIDRALREREAGKNPRLEQQVTQTIGPEVQREDVLSALKDRSQALSPEYDAAHPQQVAPVETQPIADALDSEIASTKGSGKAGVLKSIRDSLNVKGTDQLDTSSKGLHEARKAIDEQLYDVNGNVRKDLAPEVAGTLKHYRKAIDDALGTANPALKEVDTKYKQVADEGRAFRQGEGLYGTGDKALSPVEFKRAYDAMEPGEQARLLDGVNRETWKQLGINSNDLVKLKSILKGDGKWNHQKLATVVGDEKASALMNALERETTFNESYQSIVRGSKTAGAQTLNEAEQRPGLVKTAVKAIPDVLTQTATGGPWAGVTSAAGHLRGYLTDLMSRRGPAANNDAAVARILTSTRPDDIPDLIRTMKAAPQNPLGEGTLLNALLARRQDLEERKDQ